MDGFLLDTSILSDLLRNPRGRVAARIRQVGVAAVCTSIVVAAELRYGIEKRGSARLADLVEGLLDRVAVLPFETPAERVYGSLRARLERAGNVVGTIDLFIAAHALALDRTLITDNTREFSRIDGLAVENWLR
jgi:tRNA(fMet)-specific endonuclease VapC